MRTEVGMIRELDKLGRVVIPKEMRDRVFLEKEVEIILTEDGVIVRNPKYDLIKVKRQRQSESSTVE